MSLGLLIAAVILVAGLIVLGRGDKAGLVLVAFRLPLRAAKC